VEGGVHIHRLLLELQSSTHVPGSMFSDKAIFTLSEAACSVGQADRFTTIGLLSREENGSRSYRLANHFSLQKFSKMCTFYLLL
jgi:hypothetical protein